MDCAVFTASSREDATCPPSSVGLVGALIAGGRSGVASVDTEITNQAKTATTAAPTATAGAGGWNPRGPLLAA